MNEWNEKYRDRAEPKDLTKKKIAPKCRAGKRKEKKTKGKKRRFVLFEHFECCTSNCTMWFQARYWLSNCFLFPSSCSLLFSFPLVTSDTFNIFLSFWRMRKAGENNYWSSLFFSSRFCRFFIFVVVSIQYICFALHFSVSFSIFSILTVGNLSNPIQQQTSKLELSVSWELQITFVLFREFSKDYLCGDLAVWSISRRKKNEGKSMLCARSIHLAV